MFKKYPSIENHYQQKWIDQFVEKFGHDLIDCEYIITEKLHGANIQLIFEPGTHEPKIASRNQMTDRGFYNVGSVLDEMDFDFVRMAATRYGEIIHLYGEIIGPGIQKGVKYGGKKQLFFFDARIGDRLLTQKELFELFEMRNELLVPAIATVKNLADALAFNTEFDSRITKEEDNECEGVVIKPWNALFYSNAGSLFYIKKKNTKFAEKSKEKTKTPREPWRDEVNNLREEFLAYCNRERLESVFSKEGIISDPKDIGRYIGLFMKDAVETFKKEENFEDIAEELELTKEETKYIMGAAPEVREWIINEARGTC